MRVVQISDTHLSPRQAGTAAALDRVDTWLGAHPPELLLVTGDLVVEDPDDPTDRAFAHRRLAALAPRLEVLPGNHDVGEFGATPWHGPIITEARRRDFLATWERSGWCVDADGWRLIGLDLLRPDPTEAVDELAEQLRTDRRVAVFVHKPLWLQGPDHEDEPGWSAEPGWRDPLVEVLRSGPVEVVASGHVHAWRRHPLWPGCEAVWCPSTAFTGVAMGGPGSNRPGCLTYEFTEDGWSVARVLVDEMAMLDAP